LLLKQLLVVLLLTSEDAWLLGWYPSICDLHLALKIFKLFDFSLWISDLLGLLLENEFAAVFGVYLGKSEDLITESPASAVQV
jgi:hypothetical protein